MPTYRGGGFMKKLLSFVAVMAVSMSAIAATTAPDRRSVVSQYVASKRILPAPISNIPDNPTNQPSAQTPSAPLPSVPDGRDRERAACMGNNIGIGNTFVWASKFSNANNYASMVEDIENPENNVCWVRIELKSDDTKINVADVAPIYYEFGRVIRCGSWADADKIKSRILDAKKSARTWGTVAGVIGGAGVGVGAMELFGNRAIGGAVMGQKDERLSDMQVLRSQILTLQSQNDLRYDQLVGYLRNLRDACNDPSWAAAGQEVPDVCLQYDFTQLPI